MTKTFDYDISNYDISTALKTKESQFNKFYYSGHPDFMIPDFSNIPNDIWDSFISFLEKEKGDVYDQDGGDFISETILDPITGFSSYEYEVYGIFFSEDEPPIDYLLEIKGYIIPFDKTNKKEGYYFLATNVNIKEK